MEKLAGKVRWERTANGLRLEIPGWAGWSRTLFLCGWITFWTYIGLEVAKDDWRTGSFLLPWLIFWVAAGLYTLGTIVWGVFGCIVLALDPTQLTLTYTLAGTEIRRRFFPTSPIQNLRYRVIRGSGQPKYPGIICFELNGKTCRFASCITDMEAFSVIDKMLEVYSFSKDRALDYLDLLH